MHCSCLSLLATLLIGSALPAQSVGARIPHPDHSEFEASLGAPFVGDQGDARVFTLHFSFPDAEDLAVAAWRVELTDSRGVILRTWRGEATMTDTQATARVPWDGLDRSGRALPAGFYHVRLMASSMTQADFRKDVQPDQASRVEHYLAHATENIEDQTFDIKVGHPARPAMPAFRALPVHASGDAALVAASKQGGRVEASRPATGGLPYTIYYGNLHSQTNHSDGGGPISTCTGAQAPQSGVGGPAEAYQYALTEGLDLLMCSEHNHMFDGSTGTNTAADPTVAHNLFQSGLTAATNFSAAHPGFLGVYGMEWGVITNGGHLNIFNADGLCEWETNASGQLIGDYNTPKSDYAGLYTLMKTKGWVGQFNHPALSGQFVVGGTALGYSADGDVAMALCEVLNTSAFSSNVNETETAHSSWEPTFNALLAYGYHLAPSTDQDNHCANWGASYTNRTGVLIPTGTALTLQSFLDAVKARRVFATMDKNAQIILTANGHVMGERFNNSGSLTLTANYSSATGHTVSQVQVFEGVPGSGVAVSQTSSTAVTTITPANGDHFYYAKITQDNGDMLWSAPVWVTQGAGGGDTTPPVVSASETGTGGSITFNATATDNVGVAKVEFYVDGALKGTTLSAPYTLAFDSTTLTNTAHSLTAKAYDAANNVGTSAAVSFTVSNASGGGLPAVPPTHVVLVIMENKAASQIIGAAAAPYINSLATGGAYMSQSFGVTHPSEPNYMALFSGSTQGLTADTCPVTFTGDNLGQQLLNAGRTFTGFSETLPSVGYTGCTSGTSGYARKHAPWVNFPALPTTVNQPFTACPADFTQLPTLSIVVPNLMDDMHDGTIAQGDTWLQANITAYAQWATANNSLLIVTWDEDDSASANQIATIFSGPMVKTGTYAEHIDHYSVLRTLEDLYSLPHVGSSATATPITDIWKSSTNTVTASITTPSANQTVASGTSVSFAGSATDSSATATLSYAWAFGDGGTAAGASAAHTFANSGTANVTYTTTFTATDNTGAAGSATRVITVTPVADTTPPTATASETGTSGIITLAAAASDNVGVTKVEFYVDGALKGTATASPYSMTLDSTTLTNAAHSLTAKAYDAANNIGASAAVSFTINNSTPPPPTTFTEVESNNTIATANAVASTYTSIQGNLTVSTDVDYFALTLSPGQNLAIAMTGPTGVDWDLYLKNAAGTTLTSSTGSTATESLNYTNSGTTALTVYPEVIVYSGTSATPYNLALTYTGGGPVDTTPPTCSATESGTSGTITFNATATDNVGVTKVEFYVDGVLKGTDTASPYTMTLDSTTLTNASHTLTAKAYDAAGNIGTSTGAAFTVSNTASTTYNEVEPNNTQATANAVGDTVTKIVGYFPSTSDNDDYFNVNLLAGHTLTIDMVGPTASSQDYDLYLLSSAGTQLASSTGSTTTEHVSYKNTNVSAAKVITIRVNRYASYSSATPYTLTMSR